MAHSIQPIYFTWHRSTRLHFLEYDTFLMKHSRFKIQDLRFKIQDYSSDTNNAQGPQLLPRREKCVDLSQQKYKHLAQSIIPHFAKHINDQKRPTKPPLNQREQAFLNCGNFGRIKTRILFQLSKSLF